MPLPKTLLAMSMALSLSLPALAATLEGGDAAVRPQDDLFRHANGDWLTRTEIPADKRSYGTFMMLRELAQDRVRQVLEESARAPGQEPEARLIGDFYASMLDLPSMDRAGIAPMQPAFAQVDGLASLEAIAAYLGGMQAEGAVGPVAVGVEPDETDPTVNCVHWLQAGLGMPDRDYYLKAGEQDEATRQAYLAYLTELGKLAGWSDAAAQAKLAYDFERALAQIQWSKVENRDALKTYNPTPRAAWAKDYGPFPWERFAAGAGMPPTLGSAINQPTYLQAFSKLASSTPLPTWRSYLKLRLLDEYAELLSAPFREAQFGFKGKRLNGLQAPPERWRRAVDLSGDAVGEAIGQRYVARFFPAAAKARMQTLVANLLVAYRDGLEHLSWMTPATRKAALDKLERLTVKIGYPDKWRGYEGLVVKREDAVGNLRRASRFEFGRMLAEAGQPVDRTRWYMTPQTVNAYYNPVGNEIVFPAAILQPPFFDPQADDAYNYGAIGAVIGHEISHGFDDQGRHYDGLGRLKDWWKPADEVAFNARTARLVAQYGGYEPLPGQHLDGQLTLGENIADLAGVKMALGAYHHALGGQAAPVRDGLTGDQRFFIGYARIWRAKDRPEWLRQKLVIDPHSPAQFRTNGVVVNLDSFYDAFQVKPGDQLYRKPGDRVQIW